MAVPWIQLPRMPPSAVEAGPSSPAGRDANDPTYAAQPVAEEQQPPAGTYDKGGLLAGGHGAVLLSVALSAGGLYTAVASAERADSLLLAAASQAAGVVLGHASGRLRLQGYKLFQPFDGGARFVAMQAVGWTVYALIGTAQLVLLQNPFATHPITLAVVAGGASAAHGLLLTSHRWFAPAPLSDPSVLVGSLRWRTAKGASASLVVTAGCTAFLLGAERLRLVAPKSAQVLLHLATLAAAVGAALTILAGRWVHGAQFRVFMPFAGGHSFVVLQATGWLLFGAAEAALVLCCRLGAATWPARTLRLAARAGPPGQRSRTAGTPRPR